MLLVWFVIVLCLSFLLVVLGYVFNQPPLAYGGAAILFLLGSLVTLSDVETKTGYIEEQHAPCNDNCTQTRTGTWESFTNITVTYTYSPIVEEEVAGVGVNHVLGIVLCVIGVFLFIDVSMNLRGLKG